MNKIKKMIKDSGKAAVFFVIFLFAPVLLTSFLLAPPDIFFHLWPWATAFFSLGNSFFGGLAVSLTSMFFLLWVFDFMKELLSMLKVDYVAINGKRVLTISSLLFCVLFMIWVSSFFGMLHSMFPLSEDLYMLRHIGVLSAAIPVPVFLHNIIFKINKEMPETDRMNESTVLIITVFATIAVFSAIGSIDAYNSYF